ncbi:hypothetical protein UA75_11240 [Actinoalloteichus sp. GBA129-24]|uniref:Uncharacterized protein n=1 Tax=Actinoalloteichus fjordicus TaxID=1612552 RepID=A0AAC9LDD0_9PSEU|nr:hypothetical protein UA74_11150 [Actinoalloteichus fjordicus]APU20260.1 hypothetical protein UA75_11240 [Actinoalloteichus sp. GBA129-24]
MHRIAQVFPEMSVGRTPQEAILRGMVLDDAALHGLLVRVQTLGLRLLSVHQVPTTVVDQAASREPAWKAAPVWSGSTAQAPDMSAARGRATEPAESAGLIGPADDGTCAAACPTSGADRAGPVGSEPVGSDLAGSDLAGSDLAGSEFSGPDLLGSDPHDSSHNGTGRARPGSCPAGEHER